MSNVGKPERVTQNRVIVLFRDSLGYEYLGDWSGRYDNSNIEEDLLTANLERRGYGAAQIKAAIHRLRGAAGGSGGLYQRNKEVYSLMRYGVSVTIKAGENSETVRLIDWDNPENNHFAIAEEVTLKGNHERRPDVVLYVNGLAVGVLELKNSRVDVGEGIRQNLSNQQPEFNEWFFTTVQFLFAGNDSQGLRYGTIKTSEKYYLRWKEDAQDGESGNSGGDGADDDSKLIQHLGQMCGKRRLIELMYDFVLFDGGVKKLPRPHQYFGVKAAQTHMQNHQGGIIWHTQGSGKSIVMVLLARWILENINDARVAVITDRRELDGQIEGVFRDTGETVRRTKSGKDLLDVLGRRQDRLVCSLVQKFHTREADSEKDFEEYIKGLDSAPSLTAGGIFVFVDECHRTQSGKLHRVMKAMMPNAVFIGFTGTPLLKQDAQTSLEVFGGYIHTYKFREAVSDGVILDLAYEARDIDQDLTSPEKIDQWFDAKTQGLNEWQRDELKKKWSTMQTVLSSRSRMKAVVTDIVFDFSTKPRLKGERGTAMLVTAGIPDACKYYDLFRNTYMGDVCGLITSYAPHPQDVAKEETGDGGRTDNQFAYDTYTQLLDGVEARPGMSKTETYEEEAKRKFIEEPANMKLLIVVDKLLTGFDAPSCTYLYIDKSMQDHGLFQAICRTNRLDGEDKEFGCIVDYKTLFKKVENAVAVYNADDLDQTAGGIDPNVLLENRLQKCRRRLNEAHEEIFTLCEPVGADKNDIDYIRYFCGDTDKPQDLEERQYLRAMLYKAAASLLRAYGDIAGEMQSAGYAAGEIAALKNDVEHYTKAREIIKKASGETIDLKAYESDMRHLIDNYIEAKDPRPISPFDDMTLLEVIVKTGAAEAVESQLGEIKDNKDAVAETIENNVRRKIIKEHLNDPAFYEKMSELLDEVIEARKAKALEYEAYLNKIAALAKTLEAGKLDGAPERLDTAGKRALYNNLGEDEELALQLDEAVKTVRPADWRGDEMKERVIKQKMYQILGDEEEVKRIFDIIRVQKEY